MGDLLSGRCEGGDTRQVLEYLNAAGIREDLDGPLFRPLATDRKNLVRAHIPRQTLWAIVQAYAREAGIDTDRIGTRGVGVHSLRKTAITDALQHGAALMQVQELAGHADIRTTQFSYQPSAQDAEAATRRIQLR